MSLLSAWELFVIEPDSWGKPAATIIFYPASISCFEEIVVNVAMLDAARLSMRTSLVFLNAVPSGEADVSCGFCDEPRDYHFSYANCEPTDVVVNYIVGTRPPVVPRSTSSFPIFVLKSRVLSLRCSRAMKPILTERCYRIPFLLSRPSFSLE